MRISRTGGWAGLVLVAFNWACAASAVGSKPPADASRSAVGVSAPASSAKSGGARASSGAATPPERTSQWLPDELRELLTLRMQRHGRTMMFLLMDVVTLNHPDAAEEADAIAAEPHFSRPSPGEKGTVSSLFPERFFELEDELRMRARELAQAARANDDARLAAAYGQLTQSCVSCHTIYLNTESEPATSGD